MNPSFEANHGTVIGLIKTVIKKIASADDSISTPRRFRNIIVWKKHIFKTIECFRKRH